LSVGENKTELNTGSQETVGELTGVKVDFSELECTNITLVLNLIALGEQLKLNLRKFILRLKLKLLICDINIDESDHHQGRRLFINGRSGDVLPAIFDEVKRLKEY